MAAQSKNKTLRPRIAGDRTGLLADVAEMYYEQEMTQAEIAKQIGVTRSMVSYMLRTAKRRGIVEIRINRPLRSNRDIETALAARFGLQVAFALVTQTDDYRRLVQRLGSAAASLLKDYLWPGMVLGLSWGTAMSATVRALDIPEPISLKVVQLVGAVGARRRVYDGMVLVRRMAHMLGGDAFYLNAPFVVDSPQTARALLNHPTIHETIELGQRCDVAIFGLGTTASSEYSSFSLSGHVTLAELEELQMSGAVGDVCGHHFDIEGRPCNVAFSERTVAIDRESLLAVPIRIAVAGGTVKIPAILGALRAGYVNVLVTDAHTAESVLALDQQVPSASPTPPHTDD